MSEVQAPATPQEVTTNPDTKPRWEKVRHLALLATAAAVAVGLPARFAGTEQQDQGPQPKVEVVVDTGASVGAPGNENKPFTMTRAEVDAINTVPKVVSKTSAMQGGEVQQGVVLGDGVAVNEFGNSIFPGDKGKHITEALVPSGPDDVKIGEPLLVVKGADGAAVAAPFEAAPVTAAPVAPVNG